MVGISPGDHGARRDLCGQLRGCMAGGLSLLVLREPRLSDRDYVTLARRLSPMLGRGLILHGSQPRALDFAAAAGWGLHLPSGGPAKLARERVSGLLGISCHSALDVAAARRAGCDYVTLAPVFAPLSKPDDLRQPLGLEGLEDVVRGTDLPVVALGGITPANATACRRAGAAAVASITSLFGDDSTPEECEARAAALLNASV